MSRWLSRCSLALIVFVPQAAAAQQSFGSIRGVVYDKDFDAPLPSAQVRILDAEMDRKATTTDRGDYLLGELPPGRYTLLFAKEGYVREIKTDVVVAAGRFTDLDVFLTGEFTEMEEFVVQDIQIGAGTEASLLQLRFDSPALLDSVSADLMNRAGAGDAASALRLVSGATVQDGKFAVIRGLPDRYVSSQLNGVRLPSADEDTRAVELDQYPSSVIESIRVSKTFTPDQQGDASGGAVDVRLKSIPEETVLQLKGQVGYNSQSTGQDDWLTYEGGGLNFLGNHGGNPIQPTPGRWDGAVGVQRGDAPIDSKWAAAFGGKHVFDDGSKLGGYASVFYERDSSFYDNGVFDQYWVRNPGGPLVPQTQNGEPPPPGVEGDFQTNLFDVTRAEQSVQWGALGALGYETDNHFVGLSLLHTRTAKDVATLGEDTRGKEFFFPGYDPDDPQGPGNTPDTRAQAPYLRTETLEYTERTTTSLQLHGRHRFEDVLWDTTPELDWVASLNQATLDQPDKRQFGTKWLAASFEPPTPPFDPGGTTPATHGPLLPAANINLGNVQRLFKRIDEDGQQIAVNLKLPFEQWGGEEGFVKLGLFHDDVDREFRLQTFYNNQASISSLQADFDVFWSQVFPSQPFATYIASLYDIDYDGHQEISAAYAMVDLPLGAEVDLIGGARVESTDLSVTNTPEQFALWVPPGGTAPDFMSAADPDDYNSSLEQTDVLPSLGLEYRPHEDWTLRAAYSQTIARPVFKELTPTLQQDFLGGPIFIGNPDLELASLRNYDLRLDYAPYEGSLVSVSWFHKDVDDPIEVVQRFAGFTYSTPVNFPEGTLSGFELEVRQDLGRFMDRARGIAVGANATFIDSEVILPADEQAKFSSASIQAPTSTRDATNAPEHLYNLYATWDIERSGTQLGLFYTVKGDTLIAGATANNNSYVPDIYAAEYATLNASISQRLGPVLRLQVQGKNLLNPEIQTVYRSQYVDREQVRTSYTEGFEVSVSLGAQITF